jgi:hypothetical protein
MELTFFFRAEDSERRLSSNNVLSFASLDYMEGKYESVVKTLEMLLDEHKDQDLDLFVTGHR